MNRSMAGRALAPQRAGECAALARSLRRRDGDIAPYPVHGPKRASFGVDHNTYFAGEVAEVLVYNRALSALERQACEQYLKEKYGLWTPEPLLAMRPLDPTAFELQLATLSIRPQGTQLIINWPLEFAGFVLEQTTTLDGFPVPWSAVTLSSQTSDTHRFILVSPGATNTFYRLRKP